MIWDLKCYADKTALIEDSGECLSYEQLYDESTRYQKAIGRRSLVFLLCKNSIGAVIGYVGAVNGGIVPLLLSADLDQVLLERLINTYKPAFLWVPEDKIETFPGMNVTYETHHYVLVDTGINEECKMHKDLALLLTTSGSTGSPKLVRQSYKNIRANTQSIVSYLKIDENERPITTLPMNYTYGLSIINSHLWSGASILLTNSSIVEIGFWDFLKGGKATSFGGVPYTYEMLDRMRFYRMELPSLITMTQAGGKLSPALHEKIAQYAFDNGKKFVVMYGQCEATARMGYLPSDRALEKKGSMGVAIPGGQLRLVNDQGEEIKKPYTTGELVYEGENVTLGYAEALEDLEKGDERNGVLHTGDMAQFDEDGFFYIVGRKKRFLKIYGNRVNLDETDRMIFDEFGLECASTGTDDHLVLFCVNNEDTEPEKDKIIGFLSDRMKLNSKAFEIRMIESIPKNDAGKVLYNELKNLI